MDPRRVADAVEVLNWLATQIHAMPDRARDTVESGVFLALSSICMSDYLHEIEAGAEPYDALKTAADAMTQYRRQVLGKWQPLTQELVN